MSTHEIKVIEIPEIQKHPNADSLGIIDVGWQCIIRLDDFKKGDLAVYIPPDYNVPVDRPEFKFLKRKESQLTERIRVKKLRGVISQGLVIKAPEGSKVGDDLMEALQITRWEPDPVYFIMNGDDEEVPAAIRNIPHYDIENWQKFKDLIPEGTLVNVTEKIHGCCSTYVFYEGRMYVKSRSRWKKESDLSPWWKCLKQNPDIERWCRQHPGWFLYGEVFGNVQNLRYGAGPDQFFFAAFDVFDGKQFLPPQQFNMLVPSVIRVPNLETCSFNAESILAIAEKDSVWPTAINQIREGVVIEPLVPVWDKKCGRVKLKMVSNRYLEKC